MKLHARATDPETSQAALDSLSKRASEVIAVLYRFGNKGGTCKEIIGKCHLDQRDSITPMMPQLEEKGIVKRTGFNRSITGKGRGEQVWIHCAFDQWFIPQNGDKEASPPINKPKRFELVKAMERILELANDSKSYGNECTLVAEIEQIAQKLMRREKGEE